MSWIACNSKWGNCNRGIVTRTQPYRKVLCGTRKFAWRFLLFDGDFCYELLLSCGQNRLEALSPVLCGRESVHSFKLALKVASISHSDVHHNLLDAHKGKL